MSIRDKLQHHREKTSAPAEPDLTPEVRASIEHEIQLFNDRIAELSEESPTPINLDNIARLRGIIERLNIRLQSGH